jgi:hypothetical protein
MLKMLVFSYIKNRFGACGMQSAAVTARSIGVMQQTAWAAFIVYKYLHASEQHFAC